MSIIHPLFPHLSFIHLAHLGTMFWSNHTKGHQNYWFCLWCVAICVAVHQRKDYSFDNLAFGIKQNYFQLSILNLLLFIYLFISSILFICLSNSYLVLNTQNFCFTSFLLLYHNHLCWLLVWFIPFVLYFPSLPFSSLFLVFTKQTKCTK